MTAAQKVRSCRICHCTEDDCRQCIEETGKPCSWIAGEPDLCSACLTKTPSFWLGEIVALTELLGLLKKSNKPDIVTICGTLRQRIRKVRETGIEMVKKAQAQDGGASCCAEIVGLIRTYREIAWAFSWAALKREADRPEPKRRTKQGGSR
jgi:hypothetical protein